MPRMDFTDPSRTFRVSTTPQLARAGSTALEVDSADLEELVCEPAVLPARPKQKKRLPGWAPCWFRDPTTRSSEETDICAIVFDYDDGTSIEEALAPWSEEAVLYYTTVSHERPKTSDGGKVSPPKPRFRLVLPLARDVPRESYALARSRAEARAAGEPDPQTSATFMWTVAVKFEDDPDQPFESGAFTAGRVLYDVLREVEEWQAQRTEAKDVAVGVRFDVEPREPAARRALAEVVGAIVNKNGTASKAPCPKCKRFSVWWPVEPKTPSGAGARCNHKGSCGWRGKLIDVARAAGVAEEPGTSSDASPWEPANALRLFTGLPWSTSPAEPVLAALKLTSRGKPVSASRANVWLALAQEPVLQDALYFDEMKQRTMLGEQPLSDAAESALSAWLDQVYDLNASPKTVGDVLRGLAMRDRRDALKDYLLAARAAWDNKPRIDRFFSSCFGVEDTPLARMYSRKWLVAAASRGLDPGCKMDQCLILVGRQGTYKSSTVQALVPERAWFADTHVDITNKDAYLMFSGWWLIELAEATSIDRVDWERVKAMLSSSADTFRPPYARHVVDALRRCMLVVTSNRRELLRDADGHRRFWSLETGKCDPNRVREDRDQLWGEAAAAVAAGEVYWLTPDETVQQDDANRSFEVEHPWGQRVLDWLRRRAARGNGKVEPFTMSQVMSGGLDLATRDQTPKAAQVIGGMLRRIGYDNRTSAGGKSRRGGRNVPQEVVWRFREEPSGPSEREVLGLLASTLEAQA